MEPEELFNFDSSLMEEDTDPVGGDVDVNAGVKTLCRYALPSLIERLGVSLEGVTCRFEDTAITRVPEHRADHVLVLDGPKPAERCGILVEYALNPPSRRTLLRWNWKAPALALQLDCEVVLLTVYLRRGARRLFPSSFVSRVGRLKTAFFFDTLELWTLEAEIRAGLYPELAPFLLLWEEEPREETLVLARDLVQTRIADPNLKSAAQAFTISLAAARFPYDLVHQLFDEEEVMLKDYPPVKQWIAESSDAARAEGVLVGLQNQIIRRCSRRCGDPTPDQLELLRGQSDLSVLDEWADQATPVESWDDLLAIRPD